MLVSNIHEKAEKLYKKINSRKQDQYGAKNLNYLVN